jgi:hypothetical protein
MNCVHVDVSGSQTSPGWQHAEQPHSVVPGAHRSWHTPLTQI